MRFAPICLCEVGASDITRGVSCQREPKTGFVRDPGWGCCSTKQNDQLQYLNWIDDRRKPYTLRVDMKLPADGSKPAVLQAFGASLPA